MLSSHEYTYSVDVWSVGCSLAEILSGKVLFPGENYIDQVNLIIEKRGTPSKEVIETISNTNARSYIESLPVSAEKDLVEVTGCSDPDCIDLLGRMLDLNPRTRITVEEAIKHPYLESLHDPEDEPLFEGDINFDFELDAKITLEEIQQRILKEIVHYNPEYNELID